MLDWSILRSNGPVDIAGNFAQGYKMGSAIVDNMHERNALAALATNPDDQTALAHLYAVNPQAAARMETMNMARHEAARQSTARSALGTIVSALGPQQFRDFAPQPNALTGQLPVGVSPGSEIDAPVASAPGTRIDAPTGAVDTPADAAPPPGATSEEPIVVTAKRLSAPDEVRPDLADAWREYATSDPDGAMKTLVDRHKLGKEQAVDLAAQMDIIGRLAGSATDEESYQKALQFGSQLHYDVSRLPPHFSPEAVAQVQTQAMTAKDAIKTKWDIQDDQIDNARSDRVAQWQHTDRQRGQDVSAATSRRGQNISHEDRVRGQDVSSRDRQRGQDMRPTAKAGGAPKPQAHPGIQAKWVLVNGQWTKR